MPVLYNIYCDESCHLENDHLGVMVLGAVWCPKDTAREIAICLKKIKERFHLPRCFETKWTKVSGGRVDYYQRIISYFFDNPDLHFRALIVPDKSELNHNAFPGQDHDLFYYKMYFRMLHPILNPVNHYKIYIDIKDTLGVARQRKLHEVLCNKQKDFQRKIVETVQQARSHELELLQLTDLLTGAVSYANRHLDTSSAKQSLIQLIEQRAGYQLGHSTFLREDKFNLFRWQARSVSDE